MLWKASRVDYLTTSFPDRFYNLKIGIPWSNGERSVDPASVLALCDSEVTLDVRDRVTSMPSSTTGMKRSVQFLNKQ